MIHPMGVNVDDMAGVVDWPLGLGKAIGQTD